MRHECWPLLLRGIRKTKHPEPGLHFLAFLPHEQRAVTWYHRQKKEQTELPPQGTPMANTPVFTAALTPHPTSS